MTSKIAFSLRPTTIVYHKRYGKAVITNTIPDMGPVIIPTTIYGRSLLQLDSGCPDCPITELWRTGYPYLVSDYKQNLKLIQERTRENNTGK